MQSTSSLTTLRDRDLCLPKAIHLEHSARPEPGAASGAATSRARAVVHLRDPGRQEPEKVPLHMQWDSGTDNSTGEHQETQCHTG